jgi:hypothetical protein
MIQIGHVEFKNHVEQTWSFAIPGVIPSTASEVLVYAVVKAGWNDETLGVDLKFFTQIGGIKYEKYLPLVAYRQEALNTNSDNMWFPMPPNRQVFLYSPPAYETGGQGISADISVIGYR